MSTRKGEFEPLCPAMWEFDSKDRGRGVIFLAPGKRKFDVQPNAPQLFHLSIGRGRRREARRVRGYSQLKVLDPLTPTLSPTGRGSSASARGKPCRRRQPPYRFSSGT